jgi:hypothetical protein
MPTIKKIPVEVVKARIKLLEDTRKFYYTRNWRPKPTRSVYVRKDGWRTVSCLYRQIRPSGSVKHCALGRLLPDAAWHENAAADSDGNVRLTMKAARSVNVHSGNNKETLRFMLALQGLHDNPIGVAAHYAWVSKVLNSTGRFLTDVNL